ncbi:hypothetical protein EVAR_49728_1 [Eumeta japonica]|uniref:Uncharacterized protein n=1 Tax=Eumeta variegata TaxID=151549 RepID=A0A4C1ZSQ6_EUMVA|nr:hypothetical protein EVAR_49728_1 [Eumeta japonica]
MEAGNIVSQERGIVVTVFDIEKKVECQYLTDSFQNQCTNSIQPTDQHYLDGVNRVVAQLPYSPPNDNVSPSTADKLNPCITDLKRLMISRLPEDSHK